MRPELLNRLRLVQSSGLRHPKRRFLGHAVLLNQVCPKPGCGSIPRRAMDEHLTTFVTLGQRLHLLELLNRERPVFRDRHIVVAHAEVLSGGLLISRGLPWAAEIDHLGNAPLLGRL